MPRPGKKGSLKKADLDAAVKRIDEQLEHAKASRARLEDRAQEYDDLKGALESLPEKIAHPIMVPFGPMAFFEGYIEHTNEVLTQLSSEWFAMRTTKSALEMVGRRQERLRKDQEDVAREEQELQMRRQVAVGEGASVSCSSSFDAPAPKDAPPGSTVRYDEDGFLDIREPLVEDDDASGPVPPASAAETAAARAECHTSVTAAPVPPKDSDMFARLRELERMEELEELEELDKLDELIEEGGNSAAETEDASTVQDHESNKHQNKPPAPVVKSPADLFNMMSQVEQEASSTGAAVAPPEVSSAGSKSRTQARSTNQTEGAQSGIVQGGFTGGVLERVGSASTHISAPTVPSLGPASHAPEHTLSASTAAAGNAAPKRISKFKAERQRAHG